MTLTIVFIILLLLIFEFIVACHRKIRRRIEFERAQKRSNKTGKPLMVIGDPDNGAFSKFTGRDYGEGDITVDITGCPKCKNGVKAKIEDLLPTLKTNSFVIYVSCVLEYVDDFPNVIQHLQRVSGGDLFIVNVEPYCISAYFYFGKYFTGEENSKRVIYSVNPLKYLELRH